MSSQRLRNKYSKHAGYTLVEIVVSVGLFAIIMLIAAGAYLMMIDVNHQAQGTASGIDTIAFALETMARDIRTGTGYTCPPGNPDPCTIVADGSSSNFSFINEKGKSVSYTLSSGAIQRTISGSAALLTDSSVTISSLKFDVIGTKSYSNGGTKQSHVTIRISGNVSGGVRTPTKYFTVETGATMRGPNL